MATINTYTGDGSTTLYSLTFEYLDETDVKVKIDGTLTSAYSFANATQLLFNTAPANGAEIIIYRNTDVSEPIVSFFAGSSIRAQDLNSASDQVRFSVEEWRDQTVPLYGAVLPDDIDMGTNQINNLGEPTSAQDAATKNYVDTTTWNVTDETLQSGETWISDDNHVATTAAMDARFQDEAQETILSTETWISDDDHIATTAALDARFQDELSETITSAEVWPDNDATIATTAAIDNRIDTAITNDIGTDGTGITVTDDGDGTITLGLGAGSIDIDRIKAGDIITYAEQNAGSPAWESDDQLATTWAAAKRFDTIVQTATPTGTDWQIGKTWLQNDSNKTLSIWNGSTWLGIASGGTFTTQPSVIYVDSLNGDDANDGHRIITPKATIKDAVADANDGDIIIVAPGVYQETLPIDITVNNLSIVGSSQRSCFIHPTVATEENTMFRCNSGTYIDGFTFCGLKASGTRGNHAVDDDPVYGLPENQAWVAEFFPNATIRKSPYINNCTNFADTGIDNANFDPNNYSGTAGDITSGMTGGGIFVNGSAPATASPLRSFVVNEFTQVNLDGPGLLVANNGYCQAVSFFGTFCHYHAKALNGGQINMEVGTTDFGRYGLIADGKSSSTIFTATADGAASTGATSFLINAPSASAGWFGSATRPANTMLVEVGGNIYPILSSSANGSGWSVVVSNPDAANRSINNGLVNGHSSGAAVNFYLRSQISAAAHTFEYAGSGVNYTALPQNGGVANESNQIIQTGAAAIAGNQTEGAVFASSTDENGKFKVGDTFQVDQKTGFVTIDPQSYSTNLVSDLTPQLGGDLDVQTFEITTSTTNGDIVLNPNGTGQVNISSSGSNSSPALVVGGDADTGIYSPGANQLAISTGGTERARITSDGKLGLGTSSPYSFATFNGGDASGFTDVLQLSAGAQSTNSGPGLTFNFNYGNYAAFKSWQLGTIRAGASFPSGNYEGYLSFYTNTGSSASSLTEKLRITDDGKVGIGSTTDPGSYNARLWIDSTADTTFTVNTTGSTNISQLVFRNSNVNGEARLLNGTGGPLTFFRSFGNEAARIDTSGRLGVGTSSPSAKLHVGAVGVVGGLSPVAYFVSDTDASGDAETEIAIGQSGTSVGSWVALGAGVTSGANPYFFIKTRPDAGGNSVERLRIDGSGRVGISTTLKPWVFKVLEVGGANLASSSSGAADSFISANAYYDGGWKYRNAGEAKNIYMNTDGIVFRQAASGSADAAIAWSEHARITPDGKFGIGTSAPTAPLTIKLDGSIGPTGITGTNLVARFANTANNRGVAFNYDSSNATGGIYSIGSNSKLCFYTPTNATYAERLRIDQAGRLLVGTTTALDSADKVSVVGPLFAGGQRLASLTKTVAVGNSVTFDITGPNRVLAKIRIVVGYSGNSSYQMHAQYDYVSCNFGTSGATATRTDILQVEAGNAQFNYADISVSRPSTATVRITYAPTSGTGIHSPTIYADGVFSSLT